MPIHRLAILFTLSAGLFACAPAEYTADKLANDLKDNIYETSYKLKEWAMTPPKKYKQPTPIAASYCYNTLQDVLCYRQPMPGWEHRLAGYQPGTASAPAPAMMEPLPKHPIDESILPANKAANAQPIFATIPKEAAPEEKTTEVQGEAAAVDATHEQLPDPALAPQL